MKPVKKKTRRRLTWLRIGTTTLADVGTWFLALLVAVGLWLLVNIGERTSERTLRVQLEPENLPAGMVIVNPIPEYAEVRVNGSGLILSSIDSKTLRTTLDLSGAKPGVLTYSLDQKNFELPRKVEVSRVTPSQVTFHLDVLVKRRLPVRLERTGEVRAGLRLKELALVPEKVEVDGPKSSVDNLQGISTVPLDLGQLSPGTRQVDLGLIQPAGMIRLKSPQIRVRTVVEPIIAERELKKVQLEVRNATRPLRLEPDHINLSVRGPEIALDGLELSPGAAFVDAADLEGEGPFRVKPQVVLPSGIELVRTEPAEVSLEPGAEPKPSVTAAPGARGKTSTEKKT
jgi:YbbR domain-containing protein